VLDVVEAGRRIKAVAVNAGPTEWAYGLAARDPFVEPTTRNVLERFLAD
jgi:hypothetical protein